MSTLLIEIPDKIGKSVHDYSMHDFDNVLISIARVDSTNKRTGDGEGQEVLKYFGPMKFQMSKFDLVSSKQEASTKTVSLETKVDWILNLLQGQTLKSTVKKTLTKEQIRKKFAAKKKKVHPKVKTKGALKTGKRKLLSKKTNHSIHGEPSSSGPSHPLDD